MERFALLPALADGCFAFKWNKAIDINEPTQKAIIVYDSGREDLLLQVKYEGPLEEFGWLIPVPSLPKVEKGSMEAFYELSQLTQRRFGVATKGRTMSTDGGRGLGEAVKVIEIKTVGAYEVAVLSAQESGSLARWLQLHDYSLPEEKSEIVDDYIRKGWCFIAAKIQLDKAVAFKTVSSANPKPSAASSKARNTLQKQLSSGELHPLLISFDTPKCVFPLKISSVGGKPSEVSLYVLSAEPLLERFIFDKACEKLDRQQVEWEQARPQRDKARETSMRNLRSLQFSWQAYALNSTNRPATRRDRPRSGSTADLVAMSNEGQPLAPLKSLEDDFYASPEEMLQCLHVTFEQIQQSAKSLTRLKSGRWYVTKCIRTFAPEEMQDLEFQPAIPALASVLRRPAGKVAAETLAQLGSTAVPVLVAASKSANSSERVNAATGFERLQDQRSVESLIELLKDTLPQARLHAARAASRNWDRRLVEPLLTLFRDPHPEIRSEATGCLAAHEPSKRTQAYLSLVKDPDLNVRMCSLGVLLRINRDALQPEPLVEMLRDSSPDVQSAALHIIWQMNRAVVPRANLLALLNGSRMDIIAIALDLLQGRGRNHRPLTEPLPSIREQQQSLSSAEVAPLLTNQLTMARLMGLKVLQQNADADAVDLTLPLLRDTNSFVRNRAFFLLQKVSGQNISEDDPAKWEQWWAANKDALTLRRPAQ